MNGEVKILGAWCSFFWDDRDLAKGVLSFVMFGIGMVFVQRANRIQLQFLAFIDIAILDIFQDQLERLGY